MQIDEKILERFNALVKESDEVLSSVKGYHYGGVLKKVDMYPASRWLASCQSLLIEVYGEGNFFFNEMKSVSSEIDLLNNFERARGFFGSAKREFEIKLLGKTRMRITAELFDDFLSQADRFFKEDLIGVSAVIAGCVAEDALVKLCKRNRIEFPEKSGMDRLNNLLGSEKNQVYSVPTKRKIDVIIELRNNASHGKWDLLKKEDVKKMLEDVRGLMEQFFS